MSDLNFAKMHGLGNDFAIAETDGSFADFDEQAVKKLADRRFGIGFDQLLIISAQEETGVRNLRIWNADGAEVAQCGNGARAAYEYLRRAGKCGPTCILRTSAGQISVCSGTTGPRAMLGAPEFAPARIPLAADKQADSYELNWPGGKIRYSALSLGNPHAVVFCAQNENPPVTELGEWLNREKSVFPEGVNAIFAWETGRASLKVRVFERGAGETPACGSGAAAVSVAARLRGGHNEYQVEFKHGTLQAGWNGGNSDAWVEGAVQHVYQGRINMSTLHG